MRKKKKNRVKDQSNNKTEKFNKNIKMANKAINLSRIINNTKVVAVIINLMTLIIIL